MNSSSSTAGWSSSSSSSSSSSLWSSSSSSIWMNSSSTGLDQATEIRNEFQTHPFLQLDGAINGSWLSFFVIAVASSRLGTIFPRFHLPLITGYMIIGCLCGPYVLDLISVTQLPDISYVTQIALSFIAFSAGSELYLPELRSLFKKIAVITCLNALFTYVICAFFIYALAVGGLVKWLEPYMGGCAIGVCMIAASIMVARSPASAIAVVRELRAKGPVTSTMLGVTVVGDVVVLILFTLSSSIALAQCSGGGFEGAEFLITILTLIAAVGLGYLLGGVLIFLLFAPYAKFTILPLGFFVFVVSDWFAVYSIQNYGVVINFDSLLICITAGYVATNKSRNRAAFLKLLGSAASLIFIPFFTKVGLELNLLVLVQSLPFAICVFVMRGFCVFLGSGIGAKLTGMKPKEQYFMWMTMLAQAGVSLGLASEVAVKFPEWGRDFQTTIIAVVLLNQFFGPVACKYALKNLFQEAGKMKEGESEHGEHHEGEALVKIKQVAIVGIDTASLAIAQRALDRGYSIVLLDVDEAKLAMKKSLVFRSDAIKNDDDDDDDSDDEEGSQRRSTYSSVEPSDSADVDTSAALESIDDRVQTVPIRLQDGQTFVDACYAELSLLRSSHTHDFISCLVNTGDDRENLSVGKVCVEQLNLKSVVARFGHPGFNELAQQYGVIPIVDLSVTSHVAMRALIDTDEFSLIEVDRVKSMSSHASIAASFISEDDLRLMEAAMSDGDRSSWHRAHPPPPLEEEMKSNMSLAGFSASLISNINVRDNLVPSALRDDYMDRIHASHNAQDEGDLRSDMNDATHIFLSPSALTEHSSPH